MVFSYVRSELQANEKPVAVAEVCDVLRILGGPVHVHCKKDGKIKKQHSTTTIEWK